MKLKTVFKILLITWSSLIAIATLAQDSYPSKTITLVLPAPPAGATDVLARVFADELGKRLKASVIVDNRPGGGGVLGASAVARANPDGHTILFTHASPISFVPHIFSKVPYDVRRDFAFITEICAASLVFAVNKDVPARNMKEFLAWATQNKGKVNYGSYGVGSASHLLNAHLSESRKLDMTHVGYKGEAPMIQDMVGGQIPIGIGTMGTMAPHIASGSLRALAIIGEHRLSDLPQVPTMEEQGFKDTEFKLAGGLMLLAPIKTPDAVLSRLEKEAREIVQGTALKARFQAFGVVAVGNSSVEFRKNFESTGPLIQRLVAVSGAKAD